MKQPAADFSCIICLESAAEPVVTRCGHLFCWDCLYHWLSSPAGALECPMCKGRVDPHLVGDIIPLYGKGRHTVGDTRQTSSSDLPSPSSHRTQGPHHSSDEGSNHGRPAEAQTYVSQASEAAAEHSLPESSFFGYSTSYSYAGSRTGLTSLRWAPTREDDSQQHRDRRPPASRASPHPRAEHRSADFRFYRSHVIFFLELLSCDIYTSSTSMVCFFAFTLVLLICHSVLVQGWISQLRQSFVNPRRFSRFQRNSSETEQRPSAAERGRATQSTPPPSMNNDNGSASQPLRSSSDFEATSLKIVFHVMLALAMLQLFLFL